MSKAMRRHRRMSARIPVRISTANQWSFETVTSDVSVSGMFLTAPQFPEHVSRVVVECMLPDLLDTVVMRARVARCSDKGIGVELMSGCFNGDAERWSRFIDATHAHIAASAWSRDAQTTDVFIEHALRFDSIEAIDQFHQIDLYMGGFFLRTRAPLSVGDHIKLTIVHPIDGSRFVIPVTVTRRVLSEEMGVCIAFPETSRALVRNSVRSSSMACPSSRSMSSPTPPRSSSATRRRCLACDHRMFVSRASERMSRFEPRDGFS